MQSSSSTSEPKVSSLCPLEVYVVWTGTDANGNNLKSAERRFSKFRSHSVNSWVESLKETYENVKEAIDE